MAACAETNMQREQGYIVFYTDKEFHLIIWELENCTLGIGYWYHTQDVQFYPNVDWLGPVNINLKQNKLSLPYSKCFLKKRGNRPHFVCFHVKKHSIL